MQVNAAGRKLIQDAEGCKLKAYPDPGTGGAPWTIGWGRAIGVHPQDTCTQEQADKWFEEDLARTAGAVERFCQVPLTEGQFSALVSFAYNIGSWKSSTLFKLIREKKYGDAAEQFHRWNMAAGKVLPGLTKRRAAEKALFLSA